MDKGKSTPYAVIIQCRCGAPDCDAIIAIQFPINQPSVIAICGVCRGVSEFYMPESAPEPTEAHFTTQTETIQ